MVKNMSANKKGISELISYVLLVLIAVAIAVSVYLFLKPYAENPLPEDECPDGISIILEKYNCYNNIINLTLKNKGLFAVNAVKLKIINNTEDFEYDFWNFMPFCNNADKCTSCRSANCFILEGTQIEEINYADYLTIENNPYIGAEITNRFEKLAIYPVKIVDNQEVVCKNAVSKVQINSCEGSLNGLEIPA